MKQGVEIAIPALDITRKEMTIAGSRASVGCFPEALELLAGGSIKAVGYVTRYALWDAPNVFSELAENPVLKGILVASIWIASNQPGDVALWTVFQGLLQCAQTILVAALVYALLIGLEALFDNADQTMLDH